MAMGGYREMKHCKLVLVRLVAAAFAVALSPVAQTQQSVGPLAITAESLSSVNLSPTLMPKPSRHSRNQVLQGTFPSINSGMVNEIGATSGMVQQEAHKTGALDNWLIVLTAFGLIILQLRHKHKSLPQRRITPYG
jgi:hypothetical protein